MLSRHAVLTLLLVLVFVFTGCSYQLATPAPTAPGADGALVVVQQAGAGTLTANEDNTYTLTLQDVAPQVSWLRTTPETGAGSIATAAFSTAWASVGTLQAANTVVQTGDGSLVLTLSAPRLDPVTNTLQYQADLERVTSIGDITAKHGELSTPLALSSPTLFLQADSEFFVTLGEGFAMAGLRGYCDNGLPGC